jgi:putative inorganic carbon (HCO3(-)) transporter
MNLGLESYLPFALYLLAIAGFLLSVFWRPLVGIFYLLPLIPLQTIRYRANDFPLGGSMVGVMLLGVALGLLRQGRPVLPRNKWTVFVGIYALFTYASLCLGSGYLGQSFPLPGDRRFGTWQEYMVMPALLLLVAATGPTKRQMQAIVIVMCLSTLAADKSFWNTVSDRDFSTYSEDLHQDSGSMGFAGINGLAAFTAQTATFLLALAGFDRRFWVRAAYYVLAVFSAICLMYSLSRGGYVAFLAGWLFLGLFKQRSLLLLLAVFAFTWATLVPPAVQQRVTMTYDSQSGTLDNSANIRLSLWDDALQVFNSNMFLGTGFNTYEYMHLDKTTGGSGYYEDTHNYFVKVLLETGVVGLLLFVWLLARLFGDGYRLFRRARDPFFASLGLGAVGWLVCAVVASLFGDRWSFLQVNGYMWVIAGLVAHALSIEQAALETSDSTASVDEHMTRGAYGTGQLPAPDAVGQVTE